MVTQKTQEINVAQPRQNVVVTFPDDFRLEGAVGATVEQFLLADYEQNPDRYPSPFMGAVLNGKLRELSYPVERDATIAPILASSSDGGRIYRRSLVMLLVTAAEELWECCRVSVRHAVPDGGYYCTFLNRAPLSLDELKQLEAHMRHIVERDEPITKRHVPLEDAVALFEARDEDDKVRLMEIREKDYLTLYTLRGRADYYYGYKVPSTRYLDTFRLVDVGEGGFILQYPHRANPKELGEIVNTTKLAGMFHQADKWLDRLGVEDIGRLNHRVREDHISELILVAEALHEQNIARIAAEICAAYDSRDARLVLIAGPSSSGKTTFSKRLAIQLLAYGLRPFTLELDNYFVDREKTPLDEQGEYDFEALEAVNLPLFNDQLLRLMRGEQIRLPHFDFVLGKSVAGKFAQLSENQIILLEGIHGLNPALVPDIPPQRVFRVYVSALTQLNIDAYNRVPTTDVRLLRRIVRDSKYRGHSAASTLQRWSSVRRGEKRNIFPHQENADTLFNSALVYELAALRPQVEPLLLQVEPSTSQHVEANRLLSFLRWVHPLTPEQMQRIPDTSLLREFIGGSILRDYQPTALYDEGNSDN